MSYMHRTSVRFNPFPYPVKCFSTENANNSEKQDFLGFASFLSNMGPHPFIPALLGVVSVQSPFVLVVEELKHRDLLGFLWRCRQVPAALVLALQGRNNQTHTRSKQNIYRK